MRGQKIKIKNHKTRLADITLNTSNLKLIISISWQTASNYHTPISLCPLPTWYFTEKTKTTRKDESQEDNPSSSNHQTSLRGHMIFLRFLLLNGRHLSNKGQFLYLWSPSPFLHTLFFAGLTPHFLYLPTSFFVPFTANLTKVVYIHCVWICLFLIPFFKTISHSPLCCIPEINLNVISNWKIKRIFIWCFLTDFSLVSFSQL